MPWFGFFLVLILANCSQKIEPLPTIDEETKKHYARARKRYARASDAQVNRFIEKMKHAMMDNNAEDFAGLLQYPCQFREGKQSILLKNDKQFLEIADRIMHALKHTVITMQLDGLFVNSLGFMAGRGDLWFDPLCGIIAIKIDKHR